MMTIRTELENKLVAMGMFDSQAKEVVELAIPKINNLTEDYKIDFNDSTDTYSKGVYEALFMTVKQTALEWINKNKPMAWYKPMFL